MHDVILADIILSNGRAELCRGRWKKINWAMGSAMRKLVDSVAESIQYLGNGAFIRHNSTDRLHSSYSDDTREPNCGNGMTWGPYNEPCVACLLHINHVPFSSSRHMEKICSHKCKYNKIHTYTHQTWNVVKLMVACLKPPSECMLQAKIQNW